jgi:N utilization substance protein B
MSEAGTARRQVAQARGWARRLAMQALYQWQVGGQTPDIIEAQFSQDREMGNADPAYFRELLKGVSDNRTELDAAIGRHLDRPADQLDPVERAILWVAGYELLKRHDVPYRVVINEAVDLTKQFGAEQGHRYVNGVLDRVARDLRSMEVQQFKPGSA